MEQLKNKIALITGGNSGIGYATAKEFISQGAKVIITGRRKEAIEKAAQEIGAIAFVSDQANLQHTDLLRKEVENQFGKVDILFINAGIMGTLELIENQTAENYDNVMNINVRGAYFTLSKLIPLLNDGASVVMLSSNTAIIHSPNSSIYQASKAALNSIAKTAAAELAPRRIRVNLVSPGPIKTDIIAKSGFNEATVKSIKDHLVNEAIPLKKMGEPEDVAKLVRYLCGESANYITGAEIIIDGGMTL